MQASDWAFMVTRDLAGGLPPRADETARRRPRRRAGRSDRLRGRPRAVAARPRPTPRPGSSDHSVDQMRVLILSWEYPPLIEGGLARHVRKLAENMAAQGVDVHVLARGREEDLAEEEVGGVLVHRVREPERPARPERVRGLDRAHELGHARRRRGGGRPLRLRRGPRTRLARGLGRRPPREALPRPARGDHPRHRVRPPPGLGGQAPAVLHPRRGALDGQPGRPPDHLLLVHARARGRHLRARGEPRERDLERDRPVRARAGGRPRHPARALRRARRAARPARWPARVREGVPAGARGPARVDRAPGQRPLPRRRLGHRGGGAARTGQPARPRRPRHLPRLDRRRRAALALPHRRPHGGALDLRALRPGGPRGHGVRLPLSGGRHRRAARGGTQRGRRACASARATPARSRRWPSACSPTRSCATASWPRPRSTF